MNESKWWYHCWLSLFSLLPNITINIISMLKLSPDNKQGSSDPIERVAWYNLACWRSPIFTHWFQGWGWYSSTWQAKEKQTWSWSLSSEFPSVILWTMPRIYILPHEHNSNISALAHYWSLTSQWHLILVTPVCTCSSPIDNIVSRCRLVYIVSLWNKWYQPIGIPHICR